jgi:peptidyl-prolyl cis-trans isomerase D
VAAFAGREAAKLEALYKENPARFEKKQRAHVRHIVAAVPANADAAADAAARKRIEDAAARIARGEDFARVAAEISDDAATKAKGGDLGFVSPELVDPAFADAAFKLKVGGVSDPVRTATGWHLVQAIEVEPARTTPLAEAKLELARELLSKEKGRALALQQAQAALDAAKRGRALADLFPAKGGAKLGGEPLAVAETPAFRAADATIPALGAVPGLRQDALAASAGQTLPRVYEAADALIVAAVKTRERPDPATFDAQRDAVAKRLEERRQGEVLRLFTAELARRARIQRNAVYLEAIGAIARQ